MLEQFKDFEIDSLVCWLGVPNLRTEKHGDENVEAIDLPFTVFTGDNGSQYEFVLSRCMGLSPDEAHERFLDEFHIFRKVMFAREYVDYRVNVWVNNVCIAKLSPAKINKFDVIFADNERGDAIKFRVQASGVTGDTVGKLSEFMRELVRLEILPPPQLEMNYDESDDNIDTAPA